MQVLGAEEIRQMVLRALPEAQVEVRDDTHKHLLHNEQVDHHGQHLLVRVVWAGFAGKPRLQRHRQIWALFEASWKAGKIHSLSFRLMTPEEAH
jgi:BolA protein